MTMSDNPANDEIFRVDYSVIFADENQPRYVDNIEFRGNPSSREAVLRLIAGQHAELDWNKVQGITYDLYREMNNNARITIDKGEATAQELMGLQNNRGTMPDLPGNQAQDNLS